jgi:predicted nucleotidyltransferase
LFGLTDIISKERLEIFCKQNHIKKLAVFGSALLDKLHPDSDIDLLVEFDEKYIPGLLDLAGMELELSEAVGRKIDLRTPGELSRYFRDEVKSNAQVEYAE